MSLTGSLFMLSEDGGLVEYHWNSLDGWNWVEHGAPNKGVTLVGSPGPPFEDKILFLIGSDGNVYLRYMDQMTWKWKNCSFPYVGNTEDHQQEAGNDRMQGVCLDEDFAGNSEQSERLNDASKDCDPKVSIYLQSSIIQPDSVESSCERGSGPMWDQLPLSHADSSMS